MKIQDETQVVGRPVHDLQGRRLGRAVSVHCAPDPYTVEWLLVRLRGWGRSLRVVPAASMSLDEGGVLTVPFTREIVRGSPAQTDRRDGSGFIAHDMDLYYATSHA